MALPNVVVLAAAAADASNTSSSSIRDRAEFIRGVLVLHLLPDIFVAAAVDDIVVDRDNNQYSSFSTCSFRKIITICRITYFHRCIRFSFLIRFRIHHS